MSAKIAQVLARAFLAGEVDSRALIERGRAALGRAPRWLTALATRFAGLYSGKTVPRHREVVALLMSDSRVRQARFVPPVTLLQRPALMRPGPAASNWGLPPLESVGALAEWLSISVSELDWFADLAGLTSRSCNAQLRHYRYTVVPKRGGRWRLIEAPKPRLKAMQRQILESILNLVPVHAAAHGFVRRRSIRTFAEPHAGQRMVLRLDLQDFFAGLPGVRIQTFFRTLGYPEPVADLLGGICTNAVPRDVWSSVVDADPNALFAARQLYRRPHLPQGAPTSPAIANACAYRADCRLRGLAESAGAVYTRYADDLAFSGDEGFAREVARFAAQAAVILDEEGLVVNHRKTRIMRQGVRQHLAGLVTNDRLNVARDEFDRLKAILTNCARTSPSEQNREGHPHFEAHLTGRVGFIEMVNPAKGQRLRRILERIEF